MSFGATFANDLQKLIFQAVAIANIADDAAASPLTNLYVSLHTANPTASGNQTSSEAAYTSYARVAVARTSSGWDVAGTVISNHSDVAFPAATGGSETETHAAIGTASSGTGKILAVGALTASLAVSSGITPKFAAGVLTFTVT